MELQGIGGDIFGEDVGVEADEDSAESNQTVEQCNQLRHTSHGNAACATDTDDTTDADSDSDENQGNQRGEVRIRLGVSGDECLEDGDDNGDGHAGNTEGVSAASGLRLGQARECSEEQDGGDNVADVGQTVGPVQKRSSINASH